jgi:hypothetical protein
MGDDFISTIEKQFKYLKDTYSFELIKIKKEPLAYSLLYLNSTTAIKLEFEARESYLFITLYKLENGQFIDNPILIKESSVLHGYSLDDILTLRKPSAMIKPTYQYSESFNYHSKIGGLDKYISDFAYNLKMYASDVLNGNFTIFEELNHVVKKRITENVTNN